MCETSKSISSSKSKRGYNIDRKRLRMRVLHIRQHRLEKQMENSTPGPDVPVPPVPPQPPLTPGPVETPPPPPPSGDELVVENEALEDVEEVEPEGEAYDGGPIPPAPASE